MEPLRVTHWATSLISVFLSSWTQGRPALLSPGPGTWATAHGGGGGESPLCHIESGLVPGALLLMDMQLQFLGQGVL